MAHERVGWLKSGWGSSRGGGAAQEGVGWLIRGWGGSKGDGSAQGMRTAQEGVWRTATVKGGGAAQRETGGTREGGKVRFRQTAYYVHFRTCSPSTG